MTHAFLQRLHAVWILIALIASAEVAQATTISVTFSSGVNNVSPDYSESGFLFHSLGDPVTGTPVNLLFENSGGDRYLRWTGNRIHITRTDGGLFDFDSFLWRHTTGTQNLICPFGGCPTGISPINGLNSLPPTFDDISGVLIDPNAFQFFNQGGSLTNATFDVQPASVPAPSTLVLAAIGLGILTIRLRMKAR
jgi:hypothetical protein